LRVLNLGFAGPLMGHPYGERRSIERVEKVEKKEEEP
jgi:hypothetical protein